MKKPNIFISSTYSDLVEHRKQIWITLEKFEVNIWGMEKFGARKENSLTTCLREVEKCDVYILIVGMRFGSIDKKSQKSFTWLEYEKAKELDKDILIYLIDEVKGEIKVSDYDRENYQKLKDFKDILKENHTIDFFKNVKDLVDKIFILIEQKTKDYFSKPVRPEKLECNLIRFKVSENLKYIVFVGYLNNKPFEIYTCPRDDEEGVLLPVSVTKGYLIEQWEDENNKRYDFQYVNSRGYKTTIEGIDYFSTNNLKFSKLDGIVTSLLQDNVDKKAIGNVVNRFDENEIAIKEWKKIALEILI
ncbi:MAG TPA: hypothetical protein DHV28_16305 [Ignavibacteriales bacterium]|nr:hypothetical protein [Ignavibacteriales bacterium]